MILLDLPSASSANTQARKLQKALIAVKQTMKGIKNADVKSLSTTEYSTIQKKLDGLTRGGQLKSLLDRVKNLETEVENLEAKLQQESSAINTTETSDQETSEVQ